MTLKQRKALIELVRCPTRAEAARAAGVGYSSIRRWLKEDAEFWQAYQEAVSEQITDAAMQGRQGVPPALSALREIVENVENPAAARVQAARVSLEYALRLHEINDVQARLDEIEKKLSEAEEKER